jgi:hypothetical protein
MDEEANGRVKTARSRKKQDGLCTKHAPTFRGFSPGVFTVYCAGCSIMLGFSLIDQCESVRTAFEIFFCRNFHYSPLSPWLLEGLVVLFIIDPVLVSYLAGISFWLFFGACLGYESIKVTLHCAFPHIIRVRIEPVLEKSIIVVFWGGSTLIITFVVYISLIT